MDFENRIITWVGEIQEFLTEEYLINLANKGIYNRGKKELEKCKSQLKPIFLEDDTLQIQFEDGTKVTLNKNIQEATCTCIAQNICRHIMTGFLYCKSIYEEAISNNAPIPEVTPEVTPEVIPEAISEAVSEATPVAASSTISATLTTVETPTTTIQAQTNPASSNNPNTNSLNTNTELPVIKLYENLKLSNLDLQTNDKAETNHIEPNTLPELDALTESEIIKYFGKKLYNQAIKTFQILKNITFTYGALTTVKLDDAFTIYFTQTHTLDHAVCSCKQKAPCIHKLYAILAYFDKKGKSLCSSVQNSFKFGEEEGNLLKQIKAEVTRILDKGLSSITEGTLKKVEMLYIKAYTHKFYELANEIKSLSGELVYYFSRNVNFSSRRTMHLLNRIYNRSEALLRNKDNQEKINTLIGKLREESTTYDKLHLYGLGARCFLSKRKDLLITAYFYCNETKNILTMTTLRPMEQNRLGDTRYNNNILNRAIHYLYNAPLIWEEELPFERVMHAEIELQQAYVREGKLSTTKKSQSKILSDTQIDELISYTQIDFNLLKEKIRQEENNYFTPYNFNDHLYIIKANTISKVSFNKIAQRLEFIVYDQYGNEILFYLSYNSINESWIKQLESLEQIQYKYFLGDIRWQNNRLEAQLLNIIDQTKGAY